MVLSEILNWVLGGGLVATIVTLVTLKPTVQKAKSEAERAKAEAETVHITNSEQATRILMDNIVEPLKKELKATRLEMARLRKAITTANSCKHSEDCPVLAQLHDMSREGEQPEEPVKKP